MPFPIKRNQGFLDKRLIPYLGQEMSNMSLIYLVKKEAKPTRNMSKGLGSQLNKVSTGQWAIYLQLGK